MTAQVPDSLTIDGRRWAIEDWAGERSCVPTNEELGIVTVARSTANWSGRVDHFMVYNGRLYLFKVEVSLAPDFDRARLAGRRRETLIRHEPMTRFDSTGQHSSMTEWRFEYLVLDECRVDFTGELQLAFPYGDDWELPSHAHIEGEDAAVRTVIFERGLMVR